MSDRRTALLEDAKLTEAGAPKKTSGDYYREAMQLFDNARSLFDRAIDLQIDKDGQRKADWKLLVAKERMKRERVEGELEVSRQHAAHYRRGRDEALAWIIGRRHRAIPQKANEKIAFDIAEAVGERDRKSLKRKHEDDD